MLAMNTEAYYTVNFGVPSLAIIATIIFSIVSNWIHRNVKPTRFTQLLASIIKETSGFSKKSMRNSNNTSVLLCKTNEVQ